MFLFNSSTVSENHLQPLKYQFSKICNWGSLNNWIAEHFTGHEGHDAVPLFSTSSGLRSHTRGGWLLSTVLLLLRQSLGSTVKGLVYWLGPGRFISRIVTQDPLMATLRKWMRQHSSQNICQIPCCRCYQFQCRITIVGLCYIQRILYLSQQDYASAYYILYKFVSLRAG